VHSTHPPALLAVTWFAAAAILTWKAVVWWRHPGADMASRTPPSWFVMGGPFVWRCWQKSLAYNACMAWYIFVGMLVIRNPMLPRSVVIGMGLVALAWVPLQFVIGITSRPRWLIPPWARDL
jgi:hypothetical protein